MVTVPLGINAFKRAFAGAAEIKLENRFVEKSPTNQREHVALLARPGTTALVSVATTNIRTMFSKQGLFNSDLFIVSGPTLYRYNGSSTTTITGTLAGTGFVYVGWMKGAGYEFLFISDGTGLWYYTTHAMGTLTITAAVTSQVIKIGSVYYSWASNVNPGTPPDGTSSHPYLAVLGTGGATSADNDAQSLANMVLLLSFSGVQGVDFSETVAAASTTVTATSTDTTLVLTAIDNTSAGNSIATTVASGSNMSWGASTLTGGGSNALQSVTMPIASESPKAVTSLSSYVLVSVGGTTKFYFVKPGAVTIDTLDFANKESSPDPILDMLTVGDQALLMGAESTENWYATGDIRAPFAPQLGRVYQRGIVEGTPVLVKDGAFLVGNDGIVYSIGYQFGETTGWGVKRVSTHGIEERIRTQLRREQGLP